MQAYANLSGRSGIAGYEIGDRYIIISYVKGETRTYTYDENGQQDVEELKRLAREGRGLNTYLNETHK